ncbi:hypothetical protein JCGZ_08599 [Jatropha curcas]|uniref:Uncharacterized protein n=1 Tax=Jatropha curcas TaxID=180498 RepID=A0A067KX84_JATCU|nr:hypothetical protein JCGZ_08599 [Jatropha curcas]
MARGRAFDSNASGNGPRGVRAKDAVHIDEEGLSLLLLLQPPVPPSLPSIPSSSTPLGPVESSSASQSPTALEAKKYGREPTPMKVFTYTHTNDHDGSTFVDRHALGVNAGSNAESRIDELALYLEVVGGEKKRKVYGIGSQASQFYCGSGLAFDASAASS